MLKAALLGSMLVVSPTYLLMTSRDQAPTLTITQQEGYASLHWGPVPGATDYQIERTPVDAANKATGDSVIRGVWRPNRQIKQQSPSFADAGFRAGDRFRWRIRARKDTTVQAWSAPVFATTNPPVGPKEFFTKFETLDDAPFTTYPDEIEWTNRLVAASKRVRVVPIGKTVKGKVINLFVFGLPAPKATAAEISRAPAAGANCIVHGNEPSGREGCLVLMRELAFSNEKWVIDLLTQGSILIIPSLNGDGREANTRGNATGQDLNRDHARLTQPETMAFAAFERDYTPEVMTDGHEFGSNTTCDLPLLWPRHSNTAPSVHNLSKLGMVEGWYYDQGAADGWWPCPYPPEGIAGAQTFTRVSGLKNMVVTLVEARSGGGPSRPAETGAENRRRKGYSQLWAAREIMMYHHANLPAIQKAIADGIVFQQANKGRIVFHGDWDVTQFPAPHPGDSPPPNNAPGPDNILDPPPCGYLITAEQYDTKLNDSPAPLPDSLKTSVSQRLAAHGIKVEKVAAGYLVRMAQPLRGLINIVLDAKTPPAPIIGAQRVMDCNSMK